MKLTQATTERCDLQLGYSWLHSTDGRYLNKRGCDLQLGYSWLH